ncbi:MAG: TonB family protein [Bradymonadaceae bacterium]|nr:TonB family protein [Lujinxingiaceae bacterium]
MSQNYEDLECIELVETYESDEPYVDDFLAEGGGDTLEVAFLWAGHVLKVNSYARPRTLTVGAGAGNDFVCEHEDLLHPSFPLLTYQDGGYQLVVVPKMSGLVYIDDAGYHLDELIAASSEQHPEIAGARMVALGRTTRARIELGPISVLIRFIDQPAVVAAGMQFDRTSVPYLSASAIGHVLFVLLAMTMPAGASSLSLDGFESNDRFVQLLVAPLQEDQPVAADWLESNDEKHSAGHKGDEGAAGERDKEITDKSLAIEGPADNERIELRKDYDRAIVESSGAVAIFRDNQMSSLFGTSESSVGSDALHALGIMGPGEPGASGGADGLGIRGTGRGGPGDSDVSIGIADVRPTGSGRRPGGPKANLERQTREPTFVPGPPVFEGSLDREIIQRVVRQHRREITYCYESELQKDRTLAGRITVSFVVSPNGSVVSAMIDDSSLKSPAVERCLTERIRRWVFPEPKGGGIVKVRYPFNFSS